MHLNRAQQAVLRKQIREQRDRILSDTKARPDNHKPITMGEVFMTFNRNTYKQGKYEWAYSRTEPLKSYGYTKTA